MHELNRHEDIVFPLAGAFCPSWLFPRAVSSDAIDECLKVSLLGTKTTFDPFPNLTPIVGRPEANLQDLGLGEIRDDEALRLLQELVAMRPHTQSCAQRGPIGKNGSAPWFVETRDDNIRRSHFRSCNPCALEAATLATHPLGRHDRTPGDHVRLLASAVQELLRLGPKGNPRFYERETEVAHHAAFLGRLLRKGTGRNLWVDVLATLAATAYHPVVSLDYYSLAMKEAGHLISSTSAWTRCDQQPAVASLATHYVTWCRRAALICTSATNSYEVAEGLLQAGLIVGSSLIGWLRISERRDLAVELVRLLTEWPLDDDDNCSRARTLSSTSAVKGLVHVDANALRCTRERWMAEIGGEPDLAFHPHDHCGAMGCIRMSHRLESKCRSYARAGNTEALTKELLTGLNHELRNGHDGRLASSRVARIAASADIRTRHAISTRLSRQRQRSKRPMSESISIAILEAWWSGSSAAGAELLRSLEQIHRTRDTDAYARVENMLVPASGTELAQQLGVRPMRPLSGVLSPDMRKLVARTNSLVHFSLPSNDPGPWTISDGGLVIEFVETPFGEVRVAEYPTGACLWSSNHYLFKIAYAASLVQLFHNAWGSALALGEWPVDAPLQRVPGVLELRQELTADLNLEGIQRILVVTPNRALLDLPWHLLFEWNGRSPFVEVAYSLTGARNTLERAKGSLAKRQKTGIQSALLVVDSAFCNFTWKGGLAERLVRLCESQGCATTKVQFPEEREALRKSQRYELVIVLGHAELQQSPDGYGDIRFDAFREVCDAGALTSARCVISAGCDSWRTNGSAASPIGQMLVSSLGIPTIASVGRFGIEPGARDVVENRVRPPAAEYVLESTVRALLPMSTVDVGLALSLGRQSARAYGYPEHEFMSWVAYGYGPLSWTADVK